MYDVVVIGAGLVGLATAYQLLSQNRSLKICVLEKEERPACHQSGHNSGVIHSGVYYKPGTLKAKNCVEGRAELLRFCEEHSIPFKKIGKVIVATEESELPLLEELEKRGTANGVSSLKVLGSEALREIEPNVRGLKALHVPDCYIIHYPLVAECLTRLLREGGVDVFFGEEVVRIADGYSIETTKKTYATRQLISCCGLHSDRVARLAVPKEKIPYQILPFRGEYYEIKRKVVNGLVYPVADPRFPFLGVHYTPMMNGKIEAGPNAVLAFAREGYKKSHFRPTDCLEMVSYSGFWNMAFRYWKMGMYEMYRSFSKKAFLKDLQKLVPDVREDDLAPGHAGVRAQLVTKEGTMHYDFAIIQEGKMVHILNAPSPAATASLAIGRQIAGMVQG